MIISCRGDGNAWICIVNANHASLLVLGLCCGYGQEYHASFFFLGAVFTVIDHQANFPLQSTRCQILLHKHRHTTLTPYVHATHALHTPHTTSTSTTTTTMHALFELIPCLFSSVLFCGLLHLGCVKFQASLAPAPHFPHLFPCTCWLACLTAPHRLRISAPLSVFVLCLSLCSRCFAVLFVTPLFVGTRAMCLVEMFCLKTRHHDEMNCECGQGTTSDWRFDCTQSA